MKNAPNIDASQDLNNGAAGRTLASLVPNSGRPTILIDRGTFMMSVSDPFLLLTYLHESANAFAIQRFRYPGITRQQRALLGPRGAYPSPQQQNSLDQDIGNQFEKCLEH
jgi:hypothetical protein